MQSGVKLLLSVSLIFLLSSCFALQNFSGSVSSVQGYSSNNVFLNPEVLSGKKIYINFRNSTIYDELNLKPDLEKNFINKGFTITQNPKDALILLQASVRYYGIFERDILNSMLEDKTKKDAISGMGEFQDFENAKKPSKYNVDFSGLVIGSVAGFAIFHTVYLALGSGILVAGASIGVEKWLEPKMVVALIDVEISEISKKPIKTYDFKQISQGDGGFRKVEFEDETHFKTYNTKILVIAKRKALTEEKAILDVRKQALASLSGLI